MVIGSKGNPAAILLTLQMLSFMKMLKAMLSEVDSTILVPAMLSYREKNLKGKPYTCYACGGEIRNDNYLEYHIKVFNGQNDRQTWKNVLFDFHKIVFCWRLSFLGLTFDVLFSPLCFCIFYSSPFYDTHEMIFNRVSAQKYKIIILLKIQIENETVWTFYFRKHKSLCLLN